MHEPNCWSKARSTETPTQQPQPCRCNSDPTRGWLWAWLSLRLWCYCQHQTRSQYWVLQAPGIGQARMQGTVQQGSTIKKSWTATLQAQVYLKRVKYWFAGLNRIFKYKEPHAEWLLLQHKDNMQLHWVVAKEFPVTFSSPYWTLTGKYWESLCHLKDQ